MVGSGSRPCFRHPEEIRTETIAEVNDDLRQRGRACQHGRITLDESAMIATREGRNHSHPLYARMALMADLVHLKPANGCEAILRDGG